jgi:hypothetical protein
VDRLHVYFHLKYYVSSATGVCFERLTIHTIGHCPKGVVATFLTNVFNNPRSWPGRFRPSKLVVKDDIQK